jgi:hypothetical protein
MVGGGVDGRVVDGSMLLCLRIDFGISKVSCRYG